MIGTPTTPATKPETADHRCQRLLQVGMDVQADAQQAKGAVDDQDGRQNDEGPVGPLLADQPHGEIEPDRQRHHQRPLPAQDLPEVAADRSLPDIGEDGRQRDHGDRLGQRQDERRERDDDGRQAESHQAFRPFPPAGRRRGRR